MSDELVRVLNRRETIKTIGVSESTWERLESEGDTPVKTRISQGRIGYRVSDIKQWLDARREVRA
jgi:predicted DNA-binding transcriptional regulator AlpA